MRPTWHFIRYMRLSQIPSHPWPVKRLPGRCRSRPSPSSWPGIPLPGDLSSTALLPPGWLAKYYPPYLGWPTKYCPPQPWSNTLSRRLGTGLLIQVFGWGCHFRDNGTSCGYDVCDSDKILSLCIITFLTVHHAEKKISETLTYGKINGLVNVLELFMLWNH